MTIKCKAAVIRKNDCKKPYANSKPLSIEDISIDNPKDNEVLVKVKGAGLCHSDLSVINTARIRGGDSVAILGLGGVGLNGIMGAKLGGAETIIGIDIDETKFSKAKELGATHCMNPKNENFVEEVLDTTNGGVDFAIDLAGVMSAMDSAYKIIRYGGAVVTAGLTPVNTQFSFNHSDLVAQEKSILGSYMGSCVPVRDVPRFLNLFKQGRLPVEKLIDDKIGFDQLNEGFDKLDSGKVVRQILVP